MIRIKKLLIWLSLFVVVLSVAGVGVFLLPSPYSVNISWGDVVGADTPKAQVVDTRFSVPKGFRLRVFASDLTNPRVIKRLQSGDFVLSQPYKGEVILLQGDNDGDGQSDGRRVLLTNLDRPHGLAFYQDWLYVAESGAVGRVLFDQDTGKVTGEYETIITDLPSGGNHWSRTIRFGPDGLLYLSIGSSCNVCVEENPLRSTMTRYQPDGSQREILATGLRNSVDFDWNSSGELYATENGRDLLGDNFPPDELNKIVSGGFYGWPFASGDNILDPDYGSGHEVDIAKAIIPAHNFRAHNAPLGMMFYQGDGIPSLKGAAVVALHGSWNRSVKDGYKVVSLHWQNGVIKEKELVTGFEKDGDVIGRPAFVEQGDEGDIFITDDFSGTVYRLTYQP